MTFAVRHVPKPTFNREDIAEIRASEGTPSVLALKYNTSPETIRKIRKGLGVYSDVTAAIFDGLERRTGVVQNGDSMLPKMPKAKKVRLEDFHKPVVIKQPGAGKWSCDSCTTRGEGGEALLRHSAKSNHRVFTPLDGRYAHLIHSS